MLYVLGFGDFKLHLGLEIGLAQLVELPPMLFALAVILPIFPCSELLQIVEQLVTILHWCV